MRTFIQSTFRAKMLATRGTLLISLWLAISGYAAAAVSDCVLKPGNPNPIAALDPFFAQISFNGGVDAQNSGPQLRLANASCSGQAGSALGIKKDTADRSGTLNVSMRAGLDAGLHVSADSNGDIQVAGSGEIIAHNQRLQPVIPVIAPAGTAVPGHFAFILEGINIIQASNLVFLESLIEMDVSVTSTSIPTAWTAAATGLHRSAEIAFFPPGTVAFRRVEIDLRGSVTAGETIDLEMHILDTIQAHGTNASSDRGKGSGSLQQDMSSTFAYDFIPDNPAITAQWASDPFFGGLQPTINTVPVPATLPLLASALMLGAGRRRVAVNPLRGRV